VPATHSWLGPQVTQVPPPVPQWASVLVWQVPLSQHPPAQVVALHWVTHVPATHSWLAPQVAQVPPPVPQNCSVSPPRQVFPAQHPDGQLAVVQTQLPF
jgi:hypothetical protein